MLNFARRTFPAAFLLLSACGPTIKWVPSLVSHVPDSTQVRFAATASDSFTSGTAVGWDRGTPRLITPRGDTLAIPNGSRVEVYLKEASHEANFGAAAGALIGVLASVADCGAQRSCGEQDFRPMLGALIGGFVAYILTTEHWKSVAWPTPDP
jgi:hypothetical protein